MIIRNHQLEELEEARRLQDELCRLHVPSPVLSWKYEILDENRQTIEKGTGKSNSFTRNALNMLAWHVGMCSGSLASTSTFGDGIISAKQSTGTLGAILYRYGNSDVWLFVGESADAESLDSYATPTSGLTISGSPSVGSTFNASTRKLVTTISRVFYNATASPIDIVESGIYMSTSGSITILMLRDVFAARTIAPGKTLVWTYVTEVAYPEP